MRFLLIAVVLAVSVALVHGASCTTSSDCHAHQSTLCGSNQHAACVDHHCKCITKRSGEACQTTADCPDCTHDGHIAHCEHGHCHCSAH